MDDAEAIITSLMDPFAPDLDALLAELVNRPRWHQDAACRGVGTKVFFPVLVGDPGPTKEARALCASCPVTAECLQTALANPETIGNWAGTTARGRRAMRRAELPQPIPVRSKRRLAG
jgi:WhiB family redox-sensing transcriptional regulator